MNGIPTSEEIQAIYRKRAKRYDFTARLYNLIGFRDGAIRKRAVKALGLQRGDTVVEIGCGTGLNFGYLQGAIGPEGTLIGVDLTDAMLAQARQRVEKMGWNNVELVLSDAGSYEFPPNLDGIISTYAITFVPEYDRVIQNGGKALASGKRFVILDMKKPANVPMWLLKIGIWTTKPFGVTLAAAEQSHPWKSIEKHLTHTSFTEIFWGIIYLSVGETP